MTKRAPADHAIHDLVADRWSPVVFSDEPVAHEDLRSLLEAARWAPSSFNEQPWRFIVGVHPDDTWKGIFACLVEANQAWARHAPVLLLSVASEHFARNAKENRHAWHDVGLATANLMLEATARRLSVHAMAGFRTEQARTRFAIPEGASPVAALAVGHRGDPAKADAALAARDAAPRTRRPLADFAMGTVWGETPSWLGD